MTQLVAIDGSIPDPQHANQRRPEVTLIEVASGRERGRLPGRDSRFSPAGKALSTILGDTLTLWDYTTLSEIRKFAAGGQIKWQGKWFSPDGSFLFTPTETGQGKLWEVATGKEIATLKGFMPVWTKDGKTLATLLPGPVVKLWDTATGKERATLGGFNRPGCGVQFSPDGRWVLSSVSEYGLKASGDFDFPTTPQPPGTKPKKLPLDVRLWDAATGQESVRLPGKIELCRAGFFSPDGETIVYQRSTDGPGYKMEAVLWDVATSKERLTIRHEDGVDMLSFTPDGFALVGNAGHVGVGKLQLWDVASGRPVDSIPQVNGQRFVRFAPDGKTAALENCLSGSPVGKPALMEIRIVQFSPCLGVSDVSPCAARTDF